MNEKAVWFLGGVLAASVGALAVGVRIPWPPGRQPLIHTEVVAGSEFVTVGAPVVLGSPDLVPPPDDVLLADEFDEENGEKPVLMYDRFANWVVEDGTVDLVGHGSEWDFLPGNGLYVDLDGDRPNRVDFDSGRLVSREAFTLEPGRYLVSFHLAGSQRGDQNTVVVRLGSLLEETITLSSGVDFAVFEEVVEVRAKTRARLSFENQGADGFGLLLESVALRRLP